MMIPNVLPALAIFGKKHTAYTTSETVTNGRGVQEPGTDFTFFGVIQPASPRDLQILPEGDRNSAAITVHTRTDLAEATQGGSTQSYVRYGGSVYRVASKAPWTGQGFNKYIATLHEVR